MAAQLKACINPGPLLPNSITDRHVISQKVRQIVNTTTTIIPKYDKNKTTTKNPLLGFFCDSKKQNKMERKRFSILVLPRSQPYKNKSFQFPPLYKELINILYKELINIHKPQSQMNIHVCINSIDEQFCINWKRDRQMKRALNNVKGSWIDERCLY